MEIESEEFLDDMKWGEENYSELMIKRIPVIFVERGANIY